MNYSICSDLYRIEDQNPEFPLGSCAPSPQEYYDDDPYEDDDFDSDDWFGDQYDEDYDDFDDYDADAEFYAANDPSNWD